MSNRRARTRRREKILGMDNRLFFGLLSFAIAVIVIALTGIGINKISQKKKATEENQNKQNQINQIYDETNNHIALTDNYRSNTIIRMTAVGGINLSTTLENNADDYNAIFENISKCFTDSEISLGTWNSNVSTDQEKEMAKSINNAGLSMLNVASNQLISNGNVDETIENLQQNGFETIGKYYDNSEERVKITEARGIKVAILSYVESDDESQRLNVYSEEIATQDLEYACENAVVKIVTINWKNNNKITDEEKNIANFLINNGANIVIGNLKSNVQEMEIVENQHGKKCLIAYSLGDFVSDNFLKSSNTKNNSKNITATEKARTQMILSTQIYVDTDDNVSIYKVEYTPAYMSDLGISEKNNRFKLYDMKYEISKYEESLNQEENQNTSEETNDIIDKELYEKMKKANDYLKEILQQNEE